MSVEVLEKTNIKIDVKPPQLYCVIYHNDEQTPAVFVAETLVRIFDYEVETALAMTETISSQGKGVIVSGITKELANHLKDLVLVDAQMNGHPLKVEAVPE